MHSKTKLTEADPHDDFTIAPDFVPVAWADKVLADIKGDASNDLSSHRSDRQPHAAFEAAAPAAPTLDTTFRPAVADDIEVAGERPSRGKWVKSAVTVFLIALSSAIAVAGWRHYGDAATQMMSNWTPRFALASSPPPEQTSPADKSETPAVQTAAADQAAQQPAAPAQPPEEVAPAAAALSPDTEQLLQSMARDLAAMGQQIEQLRASVAEIKAGQQTMAREVAKTSETRPAEVKTSVPNPRPRVSAPPPRSAAAPARRPVPAYQPTQAAAMPPLPQAAPPVASPPPPPAARLEDDEPVVRPPMPVR